MAQTHDPVAKLNELIKEIDFAMLTTIRSDGSLHSWPMATKEVDADGVIWFFSHTNTEKVDAVRTNPRVNLAYSDADSQRYVSISGRCELVRDQVKAKQLWKPVYATWFPKGIDDPNLILLKVHVQEADYWHTDHSGMVKLPGFAKANVNG
jgi:general stress protein 26